MSDSKSRKNPLYVGKSGKGVFDSEAPNSSIPAHLLEPNWLEYEYDTAMGVVDSIQACIKPFRRKTGNKSIHNLRVALRRWFSIWEVLVEDGWQSGSYQDKLGRRLKRFYKLLGRIRDQDVNCKLAEKEKLPPEIVKSWRKRRARVRKACYKELAKFDLEKLIKRLKTYLNKRFKKLQVEFIRYQGAREETVFSHFEKFLAQNEHLTRDLSKELTIMEDIHNLRLQIKSWRYLLVEYYGVSNIDLVLAQKHLGYIVDYDRMRIVLEDSLDENEKRSEAEEELLRSAFEFILSKRNNLIRELEQLKAILPYGFRPLHISQGLAN